MLTARASAPQDMEELAAAAVANAEVSDPDPDAGLFPGPYGPSSSGEYDAALHEAQVLDTVKALYASLSQHELVEDDAVPPAWAPRPSTTPTPGAPTFIRGIKPARWWRPHRTKGDYRETGMDFYAGKVIEGADLNALTRQSVDRGMRYDGAVPTQSRACPVVIHAEAFTDLIATFSSIFLGSEGPGWPFLLRGKGGRPGGGGLRYPYRQPRKPPLRLHLSLTGKGFPRWSETSSTGACLPPCSMTLRPPERRGRPLPAMAPGGIPAR